VSVVPAYYGKLESSLPNKCEIKGQSEINMAAEARNANIFIYCRTTTDGIENPKAHLEFSNKAGELEEVIVSPG